MGLVSLDDKVLSSERVYVLDIVSAPLEARERPGAPLDLLRERLDVVSVDMCVTELHDELEGLGARNAGDHVCEQGVGRDVEGDAEAEVGRALVHEAGQLRLGGRGGREGHVELAEHMARRKSHDGNICEQKNGAKISSSFGIRKAGSLTRWIPCAHDDSPVGRILLYFSDTLRELIHALACVIFPSAFITRPKVSPLEAIHGPQVSLISVVEPDLIQVGARAVPVPDMDVLGLQQAVVRRPAHEPEQLFEDAAHEDALCGEQRQSHVGEREPHRRRRKERERPCPRPVGLRCSVSIHCVR